MLSARALTAIRRPFVRPRAGVRELTRLLDYRGAQRDRTQASDDLGQPNEGLVHKLGRWIPFPGLDPVHRLDRVDESDDVERCRLCSR